jgi:hypothetical protein
MDRQRRFDQPQKKSKKPFVRGGICDALLAMQETGATFTPEIQSSMNEAICRSQVGLEP